MKQILVLFLIVCSAVLGGCEADLGDATRVDREFTDMGNTDISILLDIGEVNIAESPDNKIHITYYDYKLIKYQITEIDTGIILKQFRNNETRRGKKPKGVTVLIPKKFSGTLFTNLGAGTINIQDLSVTTANIDMLVTAGEIVATNINAITNLKLSIDIGNIIIKDITANKDISLEANTGYISGSIIGAEKNYSISSSVGIGKNNLKSNTIDADKTLKADVSMGYIDILFTK